MIKAAFVSGKLTPKKLEAGQSLGLNTFFLSNKNLEEKTLKVLEEKGFKIFVEVGIFSGEDWWKKYPDSRPVDFRGRLVEKENGYTGVCPCHFGVREERLKEIKELLGLDIDGVWLDFIRYPGRWEVKQPKLYQSCFCANCLFSFADFLKAEIPRGKIEKKADWILKNHLSDWTLFKCQQVGSFVKETRELIKADKKKIWLGIFAVPWREKDFRGAITKILGQDFRALAEWVDVFSPMVYHRMVGKKVSWISDQVDYFSQKTKKKVLPIVQVTDFPESLEDKLSAEELKEGINQASKDPSLGFILFTLDHLLGSGKEKLIN